MYETKYNAKQTHTRSRVERNYCTAQKEYAGEGVEQKVHTQSTAVRDPPRHIAVLSTCTQKVDELVNAMACAYDPNSLPYCGIGETRVDVHLVGRLQIWHIRDLSVFEIQAHIFDAVVLLEPDLCYSQSHIDGLIYNIDANLPTFTLVVQPPGYHVRKEFTGEQTNPDPFVLTEEDADLYLRSGKSVVRYLEDQMDMVKYRRNLVAASGDVAEDTCELSVRYCCL